MHAPMDAPVVAAMHAPMDSQLGGAIMPTLDDSHGTNPGPSPGQLVHAPAMVDGPAIAGDAAMAGDPAMANDDATAGDTATAEDAAMAGDGAMASDAAMHAGDDLPALTRRRLPPSATRQWSNVGGGALSGGTGAADITIDIHGVMVSQA